MPRVNGVMELIPGTYGVSGQPVQSSPYNNQLDDFVAEMNGKRPVTAGGTGADTAAGARTNLEVPWLNGANTFVGTQTIKRTLNMTSDGSGDAILQFYNSDGTTRAGDLYHATSDSTLRLEKRNAGGSVISSLQLGNGIIGVTSDAYFSFTATGKASQQDALDLVPGTDVMKQRTITGTSAQITITNGDGVSGNPTLSIPDIVEIGTLTQNGVINAARTNADRTSRTTTGASIGSLTSNGDLIASFAGRGLTSQATIDVGRFNQSSGNFVAWYQAASNVGAISVDTAGVVTYGSFCGFHWSQLSDNSRPDLLVGTILENIDEMCAWQGDTTPNIQLARVKVSDTPGSKAVYGVFSAWDSEEDAEPTNDLRVASLGAYVVRITAGETVAVGDLIESAGNGCGRVQADDIFRSSTVAKVTATHHSFDYPDGSYCCPATLHCG